MFVIEDAIEKCKNFKGEQMAVVHAMFIKLESAETWVQVQEEMDKKNDTFVPQKYVIKEVK